MARRWRRRWNCVSIWWRKALIYGHSLWGVLQRREETFFSRYDIQTLHVSSVLFIKLIYFDGLNILFLINRLQFWNYWENTLHKRTKDVFSNKTFYISKGGKKGKYIASTYYLSIHYQICTFGVEYECYWIFSNSKQEWEKISIIYPAYKCWFSSWFTSSFLRLH